jgi:hypothetical protein
MKPKMEMKTQSTKRASTVCQRVHVLRIRIVCVVVVAAGFVGAADFPCLPFRSVAIAQAQEPTKDSGVAAPAETKRQEVPKPRKSAGNSLNQTGKPKDPEPKRQSRSDKSKYPPAAAPVRNPIERSGNATTGTEDKPVVKPKPTTTDEATDRQSALEALRKSRREKQEAAGSSAPVKNPIERKGDSSADPRPSPTPFSSPAAGPTPPSR